MVFRRVALGEEARARRFDEVHVDVDLDGGARGVVAMAQRVDDGLAHGLPGDLGNPAALHTGLAEHEPAPDVGRDEELRSLEQLDQRQAFLLEVEDVELVVSGEQAQLHPGLGARCFVERHGGRVRERSVGSYHAKPSEDVGDIRESVAHASRLQAKLDEVAHRLLVGVGDGPAGGLGANGIVLCGLAGVKGMYEGLLRCFCAFSSSRDRKKISATPKFFGVATKCS